MVTEDFQVFFFLPSLFTILLFNPVPLAVFFQAYVSCLICKPQARCVWVCVWVGG